MVKDESFTSKYKPAFDQERDEWILQVPNNAVTRKSDEFYEVRLPVYAGRALAIGVTFYATCAGSIVIGFWVSRAVYAPSVVRVPS